jgi:hypothetical protein
MPVTLSLTQRRLRSVYRVIYPGSGCRARHRWQRGKSSGQRGPTTYDFSTSSSTFTITWQGIAYAVSLVANYVSMSGLLAAITEGSLAPAWSRRTTAALY